MRETKNKTALNLSARVLSLSLCPLPCPCTYSTQTQALWLDHLLLPLPLLSHLLLHFSVNLSRWEPEGTMGTGTKKPLPHLFRLPFFLSLSVAKKVPNQMNEVKLRSLPWAPAALLHHLMAEYQLGFITRRTLCTSYMFQSVHWSSKFRSVCSGQQLPLLLSLFPSVPLSQHSILPRTPFLSLGY